MSKACIFDPEVDDLARSFEAFKKIKSIIHKDAYKDLTFSQYIKRYASEGYISKDWAYTDNRTSALQRKKQNGHNS